MDVIRIEIKGDAKEINSVIDQLEKVGKVDKKNADQFKKHHQEQKKAHEETLNIGKKLKEGFNEMGERLIAAFAVEKVIEFGQEAIKAFMEAQKAEKELEFAVKNLAGEGAGAFKEMKEQSESLAKSIGLLFDDIKIQKAQTRLLQMKLNTEQVRQIMPRIADIAAKTGQSLEAVADGFGKAISEGNTKALAQYGAKFKDTGDIVGNFNKVMENTEKFVGGAADAMKTLAGQEQAAANRAEELMEVIGAELAPAWSDVKEAALGAAEQQISFFTDMKDFLQGKDINWEDLGVKWANSILLPFKIATFGLLPSLKTSAEELQEYINGLREKNRAQLITELGRLEIARKTAGLEELKEIGEKNKAIQFLLGMSAKEEAKREEQKVVDLKGLSLKQLEQRLEYAQDEDTIIGKYTATGFQKEAARVQKEIDLRMKANETLKQLWQKYYSELEAIKKKDAEDAGRLRIELIADEEQKAIAAQKEAFRREEVEYADREKKLIEISQKGKEDQRQMALKELQVLYKDMEIATTVHEQKLDKIQADFQKKRNDEALKNELEANEVRFKNGEIENKRALVNGKKNKEAYDKQQKELEIARLEEELRIKKAHGVEDIKLAQEIEEKKLDLQLKTSEQSKKVIKGIHDFAQQIMTALATTVENNINAIDVQIDRQQKLVDAQRIRAQQGLANDLAFEERRQDELMKKKLEEQRKLKRVKELETFLNSLAKFAEENPNTALAKALGVLAGAKAVEAVFAEDGALLGSKNGSRGLGAFARRHKSGKDILVHAEEGEAILPTWKVNEMGLNSSDRFNAFLKSPFNEKILVPVRQRNSNADVVAELQELKQAVLSRPENVYDWDGLDARLSIIENGIRTNTTIKRRGI